MKTCSSLVKIIFNRENNFMQNMGNEWIRYRNIFPNQKNSNLGSSRIYLLGVDMIKIADSKLSIKTYFHMI